MLAGALMALSGCIDSGLAWPDPGVARELAEHRARTLHDIHYDVAFDIPESREAPVTGTVTIAFALSDSTQPLVLDFRVPSMQRQVRSVALDGDSVAYRTPRDHIVIPASELSAGAHRLTIAFESAEDALNRQDDFMYALFVPDRASTAFPVFEQPDLKARFTVSLTIPATWNALSNGALVSRDSSAGARHALRFAETEPISTYLVSFAAGQMFEEHARRDGREFTMYHRETDAEKVARNRDAIFDLHADALDWLEDYTGIAYPYGKFAFFAVPSFQFGGMEHPGAIWYRASSLFLDPTATRNQELGRASLIAHETAHMWFGDLVTMRWFNDVWMKEVFANFMAAKIAEPSFPDINHDLRFFQAHHPSAYDVDRTPGANPIRQDLANLREAGSLYGAIIYQKAPIAMRQLEQLVGEATMREGLRRYLETHQHGNATWPDLITILDGLTDERLTEWSHVWIEEPGRPHISATWADSMVVLQQVDGWTSLSARPAADSVVTASTSDSALAAARHLRWPQVVEVTVGWSDTILVGRSTLGDVTTIHLPGFGEPDFILPGSDGLAYGRFVLDKRSRAALLMHVNRLRDPVHRAVAWQTLWEEMLDGFVPPRAFVDAALAALPVEQEELISLQLLGRLRSAYWRFLDDAARVRVAPAVERALWSELDRAPTAGRKGAYFGAIVGMTLTSDGIARLERIWSKAETPPGLPLTEQQYIGLAEALALRGVPNADSVLDAQLARITNPDRRARFEFVRPALSGDPAVRDSVFRSFADVENRRRESWVLGAMNLMHHPLRAPAAVDQIEPGLELLEEIQATGDIFFPLSWLEALLGGHQSREAAEAVERFLTANSDLPPRLRGKLLQAADDLFRSARIVGPRR